MSKKNNHEYTNQHFVPKSYLNRFATKAAKERYRIGVVPKNGKPFINSTDNIGYIKYLYDITFLEDKKAWEHFYNNAIEGPCDKAIDDLLTRINKSTPSTFQLTALDKIYLSLFIITLTTRVPSFIDYWQKNRSYELFNNVKSKFIEENKPILNESMIEIINGVNFSEEEIKHMILSNVNNPANIEKYCKILFYRKWCVCYNNNYLDIPFITSDNPVVFINYKEEKINPTQYGIDRNDTDIYFPLTPKISLLLFASGENWLNNIDLKMLVLDNSMIKTVEFLNYAEEQNCQERVFYPLDYIKLKYGVK